MHTLRRGLPSLSPDCFPSDPEFDVDAPARAVYVQSQCACGPEDVEVNLSASGLTTGIGIDSRDGPAHSVPPYNVTPTTNVAIKDASAWTRAKCLMKFPTERVRVTSTAEMELFEI